MSRSCSNTPGASGTARVNRSTMKLRFFGEQVTRRVKETIWHPSQQPIEDTADGCIWTAQVAEWREMVPWVRGWGADVEVVGPEGLRQALKREAQRLAEMYGVVSHRQSCSRGTTPIPGPMWQNQNGNS